MSWIKTIPFNEAEGKLKRIYEKVAGPDGNIDNVLAIHSLRPHSLEGHMRLYKNVLHNSNNTVPKWFLELLGVYVSHLNRCRYCVDHHFAGLKRLLNDDIFSGRVKEGIESDNLSEVLNSSYNQAVMYAKKLTYDHFAIQEDDIHILRKNGFSDGEILEINQVVCYFNYVNRTVLGLGVNTDGDVLGLSPNESDDANNWSHS